MVTKCHKTNLIEIVLSSKQNQKFSKDTVEHEFPLTVGQVVIVTSRSKIQSNLIRDQRKILLLQRYVLLQTAYTIFAHKSLQRIINSPGTYHLSMTGPSLCPQLHMPGLNHHHRFQPNLPLRWFDYSYVLVLLLKGDWEKFLYILDLTNTN